MNLREILHLEQSRRNIDQIIKIVNSNPELFDSLWSIFIENNNPESIRAAWAIDVLNEDLTFLDVSHLKTLVQMLPTFRHDGLKRHSLRILERNIIPEECEGELVSICFNWLESPDSPVAVKMYSLKILSGIADKEPSICRELMDIIEMQMVESTPGFKSIGTKVIRKLLKLSAFQKVGMKDFNQQ